ncbi:unnamed protein product, partial [marine sediment metagenome]
RPRHLRQPTYSAELAEAVLKLREEYPRWGKDKLMILLHREGRFDTVDELKKQITEDIKRGRAILNSRGRN